ncbi:MAG: putative peptidoglycan glycosyltransferase FtsW [Zetaproteobacteria bacterium]|nr:putative peptidoglycan glycosyltransferase FtsW [Zetaproteobacteria bacterium]
MIALRLLLSMLSLLALGMLALYAASALKGSQEFEDPAYYLWKQSGAVGLGLVCIGLLWAVPQDWLRAAPLPLYLFSLLCLVLVQVPGLGHSAGGAQRWLQIGMLTWQPSELAKLAVVLLLAKNFSLKRYDPQKASSLLSTAVIVLPVIGLVLCQPDFGTSVLIASVSFLLLLLSGVSRNTLLGIAMPVVGSALYAVFSAPYRLKRLLSFLDPWGNFRQGGFQVVQSFVGFHNGGVAGVGLGESKQKLYYLPEVHTDFIMALVAEEFGLVGSAFVCGVYAYIVFLGFEVGHRHPQPFFKYLSYGLTSLLGMQTLCNLGVVMGLLPTKGLALPFMSSGLSSLLAYIFLLGLLARVSKVDSQGLPC